MGIDKAYHFIAGFIIYIVIYQLFQNMYIAMAMVVIAGALKEYYDKITGTGTCELLDFVATVLGGGLACGVLYYLMR